MLCHVQTSIGDCFCITHVISLPVQHVVLLNSMRSSPVRGKIGKCVCPMLLVYELRPFFWIPSQKEFLVSRFATFAPLQLLCRHAKFKNLSVALILMYFDLLRPDLKSDWFKITKESQKIVKYCEKSQKNTLVSRRKLEFASLRKTGNCEYKKILKIFIIMNYFCSE